MLTLDNSFETARTLEDLITTQTVLNFTNIDYIIPHGMLSSLFSHSFLTILLSLAGGAFPAAADRMMKSAPATYDATLETLQTRYDLLLLFPCSLPEEVSCLSGFLRFWWDSAGPTYYHQVAGLLAYGIPKTRLLFGTVSTI